MPETYDPGRLLRQADELRQQMSDLADSIAYTEEHLAEAFERMAGDRPPDDASRLRARASKARRFAAQERERAAMYDPRGRYRHRGEPPSP